MQLATNSPASAQTPYHYLLTDAHREHFWARVDTSAGPDACWPYTGVVDSDGHGQFSIWTRGRAYTLKAHRLAWTFTHGPVPRDPALRNGDHGTIVRLSCGNRRCCNPRHLRLGTQQDSVRERVSRGRTTKVGRRGLLTKEQKAELAAGMDCPTPKRTFAERFGVGQHVIAYALRRIRRDKRAALAAAQPGVT